MIFVVRKLRRSSLTTPNRCSVKVSSMSASRRLVAFQRPSYCNSRRLTSNVSLSRQGYPDGRPHPASACQSFFLSSFPSTFTRLCRCSAPLGRSFRIPENCFAKSLRTITLLLFLTKDAGIGEVSRAKIDPTPQDWQWEALIWTLRRHNQTKNQYIGKVLGGSSELPSKISNLSRCGRC